MVLSECSPVVGLAFDSRHKAGSLSMAHREFNHLTEETSLVSIVDHY